MSTEPEERQDPRLGTRRTGVADALEAGPPNTGITLGPVAGSPYPNSALCPKCDKPYPICTCVQPPNPNDGPTGAASSADEGGPSLDEVLTILRTEGLGEGADGGGKRLNAGKLRTDLTPPEWLYALADVTTQGSKKYEERNWELGMKWSTMIGCMYRHILKFQVGERYDGSEFNIEEGTTGCHHLAMVAWNALALMSYDLRGIGDNDFPPEAQLELFDRVNAEKSDLGLQVWLSGDTER